MKKFIAVFILLITGCACGQVSLEWKREYNGPDNVEDGAEFVYTDNTDNVYVTGYSARDNNDELLTVKYNSSGVEQWVARYMSSPQVYTAGHSLVVDSNGDVYVTGYLQESNLRSNIITIKYNSSGIEQWVRIYDGPLNHDDEVCGIDMDGAGNIYVAGTTDDDGSDADFVILKYSPSGNLIWTAVHDSTANRREEAFGMKVDPQGNVYVTGTILTPSNGFDYITVKYNSSGSEVWTKTYNGTKNDEDKGIDLVVDGSGNVFVTGSSEGTGSNEDFLTIKYNSAGVEQWTARYNDPFNKLDEPVSIALDNSGNVIVAGSGGVDDSTTSVGFITVKYNSSGTEQWVRHYPGPANGSDRCTGMAVDNDGNIYVTGNSQGGISDNDYATVKYSPDGTELWVARFDNNNNNVDDFATGIALDGNNNVIVTGRAESGAQEYNYVTLKYSQTVSVNQTSGETPGEYFLSQNYPNPFNPATRINFTIPYVGDVKLTIYNSIGEVVSTPVNQRLNTGSYEYMFSGVNLSSGVYYYTLTGADFKETKKMLLIK